MSVAVQATLQGMPEPSDLRRTVHDGWTVLTVGDRAVAGYDSRDVGLRNMAVWTLTELGFPGWRVAEVVGLTPQYVSMLRARVREEGSAGLVRPRGRRPKLSAANVGRARAWRAQGLSDVQIGRRLGVSDKTATRVLTDPAPPAPDQPELDLVTGPVDVTGPVATGDIAPRGAPDPAPEPEPVAAGESVVPGVPDLDPGLAWAGRVGSGSARIVTGCFPSRYAGAMLLHAFTDAVDATGVFGCAAGHAPQRRFDDIALLAATSTVFALGFSRLEQFKHPDRTQLGPLAGITALPELRTLRTLRPRLAAIADACDPLELQRAFAAAMLRAEPDESGVYFVDDHFVPYAGRLPVSKGYNTKRRHAERGRADTVVCDLTGRAVCFTSGEPGGLTTTLPGALTQLRAITGPTAKIMLGFDRGGAYPSVFTTCRDAGIDWITYRRAPLVTPRHLPLATTITRAGTQIQITLTDETVTINGYGPCRQITLLEHGRPALQILTSDLGSCAGALIAFLRARWRIENLFKYLDFYGIDALADYTATIKTNTRLIDNPARTTARTHLTTLREQLTHLKEHIGELATHPSRDLNTTNRALADTQNKIPALQKKINQAQDELKTIPAKLPANQINPDATTALHRAHRRALQMVLRLLAANAEHWLAHQLNTYLQDPHEYRATTRNLLHLGGTITYTPHTITVRLDQPTTPKITRALTLLTSQLNTNPPHLPGDPRPITYTITTP
jgi:hypothetical protein